LSASEKLQVTNQLRAGGLNLLYISPEKLAQERSLNFLKTLRINFIAIDEAHCISQWGHDFRPDYRQLKNLRQHFPNISIHAYTATATPEVQEDIAVQLNLRDPAFLIGSFDRPNLTYRVHRKSSRHFSQIMEVLERHKHEAGIIYCQSRREVENTAARLADSGFTVWPYHAGMADPERKKNQEEFINHEAGIMVATIAFGMGVDKSNIRFVIHSGMPKALENYQQESGRAGRDGLPAECLLFHNSADLARWQRTLIDNGHNGNGSGITGAARSLKAMSDYAHGVQCRHQSLVNYFGQELAKVPCSSCDICLNELSRSEDPLICAQKILSSILRQGENFGLNYSAQLLKGSNDQRIKANQHQHLSTWGILKQETLAQIKDWIDQLISQDFLQREGEYQIIKVTAAGRKLLQGKITPILIKTAVDSSSQAAATQTDTTLTATEFALFSDLRNLRHDLATARKVPPYVIFSDAALNDMARRRPVDLEIFNLVKGVGETKLNDFGELFTTRIKEFCRTHELTENCQIGTTTTPRRKLRDPNHLSQSEEKAFACFAAGLSIKDTAGKLNRALATTSNYMMSYIRREQICDPSPWLQEADIRKITKIVNELENDPKWGGRLKPIFVQLEEKIAYEDIKIVLACRQEQEKKCRNISL
jgi:ATP-dependent DNA helicase RecQ